MPKYFLATILFFLFVLILLIPLIVLADFNTLQFTENTNVYLLGIPLTLVISSGSEVAGMTVYSTYVSFDMESGSSVTITSNDRKTLSNSLVQTTCTETYSRVTLTSTQTQTINVTPGDTCIIPTSGGGVIPPWAFGDTTPPSVSNIEAIAGDTTAALTWQTSEYSLGWVVYGTSTYYGVEKKTTSYVKLHFVTLENLLPKTTYHYQIKSEDSSGNQAAYTDKTFTTLALGEVPEVVEEEITLPEVTFEKPISEMTIEEIKVKINEIMEAISQLRQLLSEIEEAEKVYEGIPSDFTFDKNLKYGQTSDEIKYLQIILKQEVGLPTYPEDVPATGWFGPITKNSVIEFQERYASDILAPWQLTEGTGFVGKTTRAKLNELLSR